MPSITSDYHPIAWSAWLVAAALPALLTRNPLYLSLTLFGAGIMYLALEASSPLARSWAAFVRLGAVLWLFTMPFTALTSHYGSLVLFRLPAQWPVVGGAITGEALLFGLCSGLQIVALLLAFAVFNLAVDQARLLRLTPAFIYQMGVVSAIAVGFVPQMVATWQAVREAQQVRGHRVRGLRDMLPLIMPLLITALERSMRLAESMEARGFGGEAGPAASGAPALQQLGILFGLAGLGLGLAVLGFAPQRPLAAALLLAAGGLALAWSFWDQGRRVRRSRYGSWRWGQADRLILACSLLSGLTWLAARLWAGGWLFYYPYPPYSPWPDFQPLLGLAPLALVLPALFVQRTHERAAP